MEMIYLRTMAQVLPGYAHGDNVHFSYLFPSFMLEVFNSNVTYEGCTIALLFITKYCGKKYILSPLVQMLGGISPSRPYCIFCYVSHAIVSGTYIIWWPEYLLPRLDQNVLSQLAEYDDVNRGPPFLALPMAPNPKSTNDRIHANLGGLGLFWHSPKEKKPSYWLL